MRKIFKKGLAATLAVLLCISNANMSVFAETMQTQESIMHEEQTEENDTQELQTQEESQIEETSETTTEEEQSTEINTEITVEETEISDIQNENKTQTI